MRIGIPRETKPGELRVALLPDHVAILARDGHEIRVASGAAGGIGQLDASYLDAGALIVAPHEAWDSGCRHRGPSKFEWLTCKLPARSHRKGDRKSYRGCNAR